MKPNDRGLIAWTFFSVTNRVHKNAHYSANTIFCLTSTYNPFNYTVDFEGSIFLKRIYALWVARVDKGSIPLFGCNVRSQKFALYVV